MNQNHISAADAFEKASDIFTLIEKFASNNKLQISTKDVPDLVAISSPHYEELRQLGYHLSNTNSLGLFTISWKNVPTQKQKEYLSK